MSLSGEIPDVVNKAFEGGYPALVATATPDGTPHTALRGSVLVLDEKRMAFWDRTGGTTLNNIKKNPKLMIFVRNPQTRMGWRFLGRGSVVEDDGLRELIWSRVVQPEKDRDPEKKGVAVIVDVDFIVPFRGVPIPILKT